MKDLQIRLNKITDHISQEKQAAIELLKDYIRQHGEIDWSEEEYPLETTFYVDGYCTEKVERVTLDDDELCIATEDYCYCESCFTNDTVLDILCTVIGNNEII